CAVAATGSKYWPTGSNNSLTRIEEAKGREFSQSISSELERVGGLGTGGPGGSPTRNHYATSANGWPYNSSMRATAVVASQHSSGIVYLDYGEKSGAEAPDQGGKECECGCLRPPATDRMRRQACGWT